MQNEVVVKAQMEELDSWIDSMETLRARRANGGTLTETQSMLLNLYVCMMGQIEMLEDHIERLDTQLGIELQEEKR